MLRKNVSLSDAHLRLLDPLLKKHQGNLSATMRDIIDFTGFVTENMGSLEIAKDLLRGKNRAKEQTLHRIYGVTIPLTMFQWLLANRKTPLPPLNHATQIFIPLNDVNVYDVNNLSNMINEEMSFLNWPVNVVASSEDGHISFQITGTDQIINIFTAVLISISLATHKNAHKISKLLLYPASIYLQVSEAASADEAINSIHENFSNGNNDVCDMKNIMQIKIQ